MNSIKKLFSKPTLPTKPSAPSALELAPGNSVYIVLVPRTTNEYVRNSMSRFLYEHGVRAVVAAVEDPTRDMTLLELEKKL